jgi:hypothetical protein
MDGATVQVEPNDHKLLACVESAATDADRPARPVKLQALLQLPRLADHSGSVALEAARTLVAHLAVELPTRDAWFVPGLSASPRSLGFGEVDSATANDVMERFHYLRSPRTDGRAYGLKTKADRLVALCVLSPLDVPRLHDLLSDHGRSGDRARVVSRVFVFEGAPANSISFLLSRATRAERLHGATDFVTYVNPNMGFAGSSYRASGWQQLGDEPGTTYRYVDNRYRTDRSIAAEYGQHDDDTYRRLLGQRFAVSTMLLAPLLVFHTTSA